MMQLEPHAVHAIPLDHPQSLEHWSDVVFEAVVTVLTHPSGFTLGSRFLGDQSLARECQLQVFGRGVMPRHEKSKRIGGFYAI